jgi:hypothetical protein
VPAGPFVLNTLKEWKLACPKGDIERDADCVFCEIGASRPGLMSERMSGRPPGSRSSMFMSI